MQSSVAPCSSSRAYLEEIAFNEPRAQPHPYQGGDADLIIRCSRCHAPYSAHIEDRDSVPEVRRLSTTFAASTASSTSPQLVDEGSAFTQSLSTTNSTQAESRSSASSATATRLTKRRLESYDVALQSPPTSPRQDTVRRRVLRTALLSDEAPCFDIVGDSMTPVVTSSVSSTPTGLISGTSSSVLSSRRTVTTAGGDNANKRLGLGVPAISCLHSRTPGATALGPAVTTLPVNVAGSSFPGRLPPRQAASTTATGNVDVSLTDNVRDNVLRGDGRIQKANVRSSNVEVQHGVVSRLDIDDDDAVQQQILDDARLAIAVQRQQRQATSSVSCITNANATKAAPVRNMAGVVLDIVPMTQQRPGPLPTTSAVVQESTTVMTPRTDSVRTSHSFEQNNDNDDNEDTAHIEDEPEDTEDNDDHQHNDDGDISTKNDDEDDKGVSCAKDFNKLLRLVHQLFDSRRVRSHPVNVNASSGPSSTASSMDCTASRIVLAPSLRDEALRQGVGRMYTHQLLSSSTTASSTITFSPIVPSSAPASASSVVSMQRDLVGLSLSQLTALLTHTCSVSNKHFCLFPGRDDQVVRQQMVVTIRGHRDCLIRGSVVRVTSLSGTTMTCIALIACLLRISQRRA